jgi:TRAP-type mannitol/chloroaromatic compound transport system substrate-binding protein
MPGGEVYEAMERGVIDGLISANVAWCFDYGFHEVSKYVYVSEGINIGTLEFAVNMDAWNKLPDDLKSIVSVCAREAEIAMLALNQNDDQLKLHEAVQKWGVKTQGFDAESIGKMRAAMMEAVDEYAKADADYAELAKALKSYLEVEGD